MFRSLLYIWSNHTDADPEYLHESNDSNSDHNSSSGRKGKKSKEL